LTGGVLAVGFGIIGFVALQIGGWVAGPGLHWVYGGALLGIGGGFLLRVIRFVSGREAVAVGLVLALLATAAGATVGSLRPVLGSPYVWLIGAMVLGGAVGVALGFITGD